MTENTTDNILSSFFRQVASFWGNASRYHGFFILAAIGLIVTLLLFFMSNFENDTNVVLNTIIFCVVAGGVYLLLRQKSLHLAAFTFAAALLLRICLIFVMESAPTDVYMSNDDRARTYKWIRHYNSVLLQADEFFYAYHIQTYKNITTSEFLKLPELLKNSHRTSFLMSRVFRILGDEFVWLRLFEAFLGAFAAMFLILAAREFFSKHTLLIISLLSVIAPQTAFYSVRFLKETWVIFAASLMVFGFTVIIRNKKYISAILPMAIGGAILIWLRLEYGLMCISVIPMAIYFRGKSSYIGKFLITVPMLLLIVMIAFYQFDRLSQKTENLFNKYEHAERGQKGRAESVAILDKTYTSQGPLRLLNVPLSVLNPPPRRLHHVVAPANGLHDIVLQADIWQWWLLLPFLGIGTIATIIKYKEFLVFLLPYIAAVSISAILLGGLLPSVYRYRDSLAPVAFIIIGVGLESYISNQNRWKNIIILFTCLVFAVLTVFLYANGF